MSESAPETPLRSTDDIKKDLDFYAREIGKNHHQLKCVEQGIQQLTNTFNGLLIELSNAEEAADVQPQNPA